MKNDAYYVDKLIADIEFIQKHMSSVDIKVIFETLKYNIPELLEDFKR